MTIPLTQTEWNVLTFLQQHIRQHGYAPTHRDICQAVGLHSTSSVADVLRRLASKGAINYQRHSRRAIQVKRVQVAIVP